MSDVQERAIEAFGNWLGSLAGDTLAVSDVVADEGVAADIRRPLAGSLNYLFKSLDLIDDGIEGLGFLDDAFVIRIAAVHAKKAGSLPESLSNLAEDAGLIEEFLDDLYGRLDQFVAKLVDASVRGRSVSAILEDAAVRDEVLADVRGWANRYSAPQFVMDEHALVKLKSFLGAKLP
jgi:uncharacterized membrane protein YkvA (DUF1232 family)